MVASLCQAQAGEDLAPPQVTVTVTEHATSAEMVEVTALAANYPADLLKQQAEAVGRNAGSESRGVSVFKIGSNERIRFLKARFATDNLIDRSSSTLWLEPVVHAFLGASAPFTVTSLLVTFDGEKPVPGKTLQDFSSPGVDLTARSYEAPRAVEYRIELKSQDPAVVKIPKLYEASSKSKSKTAEVQAPNLVMLALVGVAGIAGGALVYFWVVARQGRRRIDGSPRT